MFEGLIKIILLPITMLLGLVGLNNTTVQDVGITPTPTPENVIVATGSISEQNVTVDLAVTMPQSGGALLGSISGVCKGTIQGTYDGKENGAIAGTLDGNCGVAFIQYHATGTFQGNVVKTKGEVTITYNAQADTYTKTGTVVLHFTPFTN